MIFHNQQTCKRCGSGMQAVATIAPTAGKPGLDAFVCSSCGTCQSVLVHPTQPRGQVHHGHRANRREASDHAWRR